MIFPLDGPNAWANSQVYGHGGHLGPDDGRECDEQNYSGPWRDTWCEHRDRRYTDVTCPLGRGHTGVDIRPATCDDKQYSVLAAEAGTVVYIGDYSVMLRSESGAITYQYLHMSHDLTLHQEVTKGEQIGLASNVFGDTRTTIHLHFGMKRNDFSDAPPLWVSPYAALVSAYQRKLPGGSRVVAGELTSQNPKFVSGWAVTPSHRHEPLRVSIHVDGGLQPYADVTASSIVGAKCIDMNPCPYGFVFVIPPDLDWEWMQFYAWIDGTPVLLDGGQINR